MTSSQAIYDVHNLVIDLHTATASIRAVDGVSFGIRPGETVAVVGESGSGKTVMTLGPLGLLPEGVRVDIRGEARAEGGDLLTMNSRAVSALRGRYFGVVFQDPMSALNPMLKVGPQLAAQIRRFRGADKTTAKREAINLLRRTGIPDPEDRFDRYPHEMSGGMLQRVMIALALAARPPVLIADEPTTALDATVQAQILELLRQIQREDGIAVILITHDIGAVAAAADRVVVLYAGQVAEQGTVVDVLTQPAHPYTRGLLASVPDFRSGNRIVGREISGSPPNQIKLSPGCRFADRCPLVQPECRVHRPLLETVKQSGGDHLAACPVIAATEAEHVIA
ncbi:ABC transporter ATP-binding protein (plasmid) [Shinella sp. PSBB067]|uniref:ABC transporter ATP-binding protein n=1 Tax=Shinella sp. PSBB067 TaxID=2715959 RepID=UPI00193BE2E9|nr:ABC transporter ATP-binding protein [Shinella sp. PSBB067]QRI66720.1 ABC transporter ATP-binding protein [Shinella sp. PSBB067]